MNFARIVRFAGIAAWSIAVLSGYLWLTAHQFEAVATPPPPSAYPIEAPGLFKGRANLLMFVHPKCPCTAASLEQLERIIADAGPALAAQVYVFSPREAAPDWCSGPNWDRASALPGASIHVDVDGRLARQFSVSASGSVVVYDADGNLAYSGGITSQRGHVGASAGGDAVLKVARGQTPASRTMPVFGCSLFGSVAPGETAQ